MDYVRQDALSPTGTAFQRWAQPPCQYPSSLELALDERHALGGRPDSGRATSRLMRNGERKHRVWSGTLGGATAAA